MMLALKYHFILDTYKLQTAADIDRFIKKGLRSFLIGCILGQSKTFVLNGHPETKLRYFPKKTNHKMGAQVSKIEDTIHDIYKKTWPQAWYLAPSFLASLGALGYAGYAFAQNKPAPSSPNLSFLHLLGVAGGFGISFWITAVHGRAVQRMLTRHEFATVQSHLSSVYFSSSSILASLSLGTFLLRHPFHTWSKEARNLGMALIAALVAAELNSIILNPLVTNLMLDRNNIEFLQAAKTSDDIERLAHNDTKYRMINNKFNLFHSISMVSGLVYHGVQWYHLYFLADRCLVL